MIETDLNEIQGEDADLSVEEKRLMLQSYFEAVSITKSLISCSPLTALRVAAC